MRGGTRGADGLSPMPAARRPDRPQCLLWALVAASFCSARTPGKRTVQSFIRRSTSTTVNTVAVQRDPSFRVTKTSTLQTSPKSSPSLGRNDAWNSSMRTRYQGSSHPRPIGSDDVLWLIARVSLVGAEDLNRDPLPHCRCPRSQLGTFVRTQLGRTVCTPTPGRGRHGLEGGSCGLPRVGAHASFRRWRDRRQAQARSPSSTTGCATGCLRPRAVNRSRPQSGKDPASVPPASRASAPGRV